MKVIHKVTLNNREFILSEAIRPCGKIGYYAHELGGLTQWAELFGTGQRKAHRINPSMRVKGMHYIPRPYKTEDEGLQAIKEHSEKTVIYV